MDKIVGLKSLNTKVMELEKSHYDLIKENGNTKKNVDQVSSKYSKSISDLEARMKSIEIKLNDILNS